MKAFLKGIIALAPITCITPALIASPSISNVHTTTTAGVEATITDLNIQVDLATGAYRYVLPAVDDTTFLSDFKHSIIENVHENKSIDLKINELSIYYQTTDRDRVSLLTNDTQTLAECGIKNEGTVTIIINGSSGLSDL
jgi:hypothetical protein